MFPLIYLGMVNNHDGDGKCEYDLWLKSSSSGHIGYLSLAMSSVAVSKENGPLSTRTAGCPLIGLYRITFLRTPSRIGSVTEVEKLESLVSLASETSSAIHAGIEY